MEFKQIPVSGNQGVDLIASMNDLRLCMIWKDHQKTIGHKDIQEVYVGKKYWLGTLAILISRYGFTKSVQKLSSLRNVLLINEFEIENIKDINY